MKARAALVLGIIIAAAACIAPDPVDVRVEMPGPTPFPPGSLTEVVVTDFENEATLPDFDPALEFQAYLASALGPSFKGTVSRLALDADARARTSDPSFWRACGGRREGTVFLTGSVRLAGSARKALKGKRAVVDGPFKTAGRGVIEQVRWTFSVVISVVSAASGETLMHKNFVEEKDYIELDKPAEFAFSELSERVRNRLFPILLGTPTTESRTLLRR